MHKRILLKLSGESLAAENKNKGPAFGINQNMLKKIATEIKALHDKGLEIAIVVGGGNFFRGASSKLPTLDRASADYVGMLATVMNAVALQSVLKHMDIDVRHISSIPVTVVAENYVRNRCIHHLEKKRVVIFSAGTGNPFFTTDTAAVLRAIEMECNILLKATKVNGAYCSDPVNNPSAQHFKKLSYKNVIEKKIKVMDSTAITLAHENQLPVAIFSIYEDNSLEKVLRNDTLFTLIGD